MLTPLDIHNKEFKRSFRGYNEDEIDDFLDQVVNDYEKLFRENDNLKEELARMKKDNAQYQKLENNLKETLLIAQKTANEVTDTAKQHAENLRESTAKECQNMRRDAEISARQMVEAADHQVKSATVEYCRLVEAKSQFLYQIKAALESELAVLMMPSTVCRASRPLRRSRKRSLRQIQLRHRRMPLQLMLYRRAETAPWRLYYLS